MTRPTAVLLAVVVTAITVPAVLAWGPPGVFVSMGGFAFGWGVGWLVDWITDHFPEDYPHD